MKDDELQRHIDKLLHARREFESARDELVTHVYGKLGRLAKKIFREDFSRLGRRHETGTVHHEALLRIRKSLVDARFSTVTEFEQWSAEAIRNTLYDLSRKHDARGGGKDFSLSHEDISGAPVPADCVTPEILAIWSEIHQQVAKLPEENRAVFELCFYLGKTQEEVAKTLGISQATVSRRLDRAITQLPKLPADGD